MDIKIQKSLKKIFHLIPEELLKSLDTKKSQELGLNLLNMFNPSYLPANFKFSINGGWITPDGSRFIKAQTSGEDELLKSWIENPKKDIGYDILLFSKGWIRQDWYQPISTTKFIDNKNLTRKLTFIIDPTSLRLRNLNAIVSIARFYTIVMPKGFYYELALIKHENNNIIIKRKLYKDLDFFILGLNSIKS